MSRGILNTHNATALIHSIFWVHIQVHHLPAPSFILFAQLFGTALGVKSAFLLGFIEKLEPIELQTSKAFAPAALIFVATILLNMKSLEYANVVREFGSSPRGSSRWLRLQLTPDSPPFSILFILQETFMVFR